MEGISVEQAVEQILQHTPVINETEETELNKAGGRVLAQDMVAGFDNPPFDRSPVDGYACKAEDLAGAAKEHPVRLKVMEEIDAGQYSEREIQQGQAVRIMTGAAIPNGCNTQWLQLLYLSGGYRLWRRYGRSLQRTEAME